MLNLIACAGKEHFTKKTSSTLVVTKRISIRIVYYIFAASPSNRPRVHVCEKTLVVFLLPSVT